MGFFMFLFWSGRFNCPYEKALYAQKPPLIVNICFIHGHFLLYSCSVCHFYNNKLATNKVFLWGFVFFLHFSAFSLHFLHFLLDNGQIIYYYYHHKSRDWDKVGSCPWADGSLVCRKRASLRRCLFLFLAVFGGAGGVAVM